MHISLLVVGRLKRGPERDLVDEYLKRANGIARNLGFRSVREREVADGGGPDAESERLVSHLPADAICIRLDEHGQAQSSVEFSEMLAMRRDNGTPEIVFLIGGAEGYGPEIKAAVPQTLAFGPQTWPHRFVRVMLAEQIYRALTILAGSPYHKA